MARKKGSIARRVLKWLARIVLSLVALVILLVVALYLPPVQQWLKGWAEDWLSEETGMEVRIERVRLAFPLDLSIQNVSMVESRLPAGRTPDTIIAAQELLLDVKVMPLIDGRIDLNGFELRNARLNTKDFIGDLRLAGHATLLKMDMPAVCDLTKKRIDANRLRLSGADLSVVLSDTAAVDTTEEPSEWQIAIDELKIEDTRFDVQLQSVDVPPAKRMPLVDRSENWPLQTYLQLSGHAHDLSLRKATLNLHDAVYEVQNVSLNATDVAYNVPYEKQDKGLDFNHLFFPSLRLNGQNLHIGDDGIDLGIESLSLTEKSGLTIDNIAGRLHYDSTVVRLDNGHIKTPYSNLNADVAIGADDELAIKVSGNVGRHDVMLFAGDALGDIAKHYPDKPLGIKLHAKGSLNNLDIDYAHATLPGMIDAQVSGRLRGLDNGLKQNGQLHYSVALQDASFVRALMPKDLQQQLHIPNGTRIGGDLSFGSGTFNFDRNTISSGKGSLTFSGKLSSGNMSYDAHIVGRQFPLQNFLPGMGLTTLSGEFDLAGRGTDFLNPGTTLTANAKINSFSFAGIPLNNLNIKTSFNGNTAHGHLNINNSWINAALDFAARNQSGRMSGELDGRISRLQPQKLNGFASLETAESDLQFMADVHLKGFYEEKTQRIALGGSIDNLNAVDSRMGYPGGSVNFGLGTSPDSTHIYLNSGDMTLRARANDPLEKIIDGFSSFGDELSAKLTSAQLDHNTLKQMLPDMRIRLTAGNRNPLHQLFRTQGYQFDSLYAHIATDAVSGVNGDIGIDNFRTGSVLLEETHLTLSQDSDALNLHAGIVNSAKKNPNRFTASVDGSLLKDGFRVMANFKDEKNREGINIGTHATFDGHGGIRLSLIPEVSTLAFRKFKVNDNNFIEIDSAGFITADIDLLADDNTNLKLFSINQDSINQDITLSIANLSLHDLSTVIPFMPEVGGFADGDIHIIKTPQSFTAVGQVATQKLELDGLYIGDIGTELFYMPEGDSHYVVAQILSEEKEVAVLDGYYYDTQDGTLDATLSLNRFPVALLNTFISDDGTLALSGQANGEIRVAGPTSKLVMNGKIAPDSLHVYSDLYGFYLTMEDKDIVVEGSKIVLDQMKFYGRETHHSTKSNNLVLTKLLGKKLSKKKDKTATERNAQQTASLGTTAQDTTTARNPMIIDGTVDFSQLDNIIYDLAITARDFELINAEKTKQSILYGQVFVDMDATLKGKEGFMMLRGDLGVLRKTDLSYILRDTPLQVDDLFSGLVEFVDFSDDGLAETAAPETGGLFVNLDLSVDEAAHLHCDLSEDGKSYVDCNGGGDLTMRMFPSGDLSLTGRFNIHGGEMKYTLPFIPLKTFTFTEGNYILFTGEPDNPTLNITATERTKASVTGDDGASRMVVFDVGVQLSKQLSNMGVEFLIDAPEDSEIQSQLSTMSAESRNKAAITMLATGLYTSSNNKSGFMANNALNAFIESEIQNIAGSALKTMDISVGVEGNTTTTGETQTDYTFQFSKKLWNDRVTFVIGGKVSTGASDNTSSTQSFIDNISLEYRLNKFGTHYIQLFYDNDTHDPFEGSYSSAGAGYIWRRQSNSLGELLLFKHSKNK